MVTLKKLRAAVRKTILNLELYIFVWNTVFNTKNIINIFKEVTVFI